MCNTASSLRVGKAAHIRGRAGSIRSSTGMLVGVGCNPLMCASTMRHRRKFFSTWYVSARWAVRWAANTRWRGWGCTRSSGMKSVQTWREGMPLTVISSSAGGYVWKCSSLINRGVCTSSWCRNWQMRPRTASRRAGQPRSSSGVRRTALMSLRTCASRSNTLVSTAKSPDSHTPVSSRGDESSSLGGSGWVAPSVCTPCMASINKWHKATSCATCSGPTNSCCVSVSNFSRSFALSFPLHTVGSCSRSSLVPCAAERAPASLNLPASPAKRRNSIKKHANTVSRASVRTGERNTRGSHAMIRMGSHVS
mmetsp:Transcript_111/g.215  ORF Transcript_111/g.215 Transcript_111/m.215 type:complete len:309 (-) Transcript_111:617-1543(-)